MNTLLFGKSRCNMYGIQLPLHRISYSILHNLYTNVLLFYSIPPFPLFPLLPLLPLFPLFPQQPLLPLLPETPTYKAKIPNPHFFENDFLPFILCSKVIYRRNK